jgi:hypothetical protein
MQHKVEDEGQSTSLAFPLFPYKNNYAKSTTSFHKRITEIYASDYIYTHSLVNLTIASSFGHLPC